MWAYSQTSGSHISASGFTGRHARVAIRLGSHCRCLGSGRRGSPVGRDSGCRTFCDLLVNEPHRVCGLPMRPTPLPCGEVERLRIDLLEKSLANRIVSHGLGGDVHALGARYGIGRERIDRALQNVGPIDLWAHRIACANREHTLTPENVETEVVRILISRMPKILEARVRRILAQGGLVVSPSSTSKEEDDP
jgi:hypothetical protein